MLCVGIDMDSVDAGTAYLCLLADFESYALRFYSYTFTLLVAWRPVKYCFSISEVFLDTFGELGLTCKMAFKWLCASLIYISYMYMYGSPVHLVALMSKLLRLLLFLNTILGVEASRMLLN